VAAVAGFGFILAIFVCIGGSTDAPEPAPSMKAPQPNLKDWNTPSRPGIDGPEVKVTMRSGRVYRGTMLSKTSRYVRIKHGRKILRIERKYIRGLVYE
jgi:hypothetical protein